MAKGFILLGFLSILLGVLWHFFPNFLSWFGRLPGDIRIEKGDTKIYIPLTTMVLLSLLLTLLSTVFRR